MYVPFSRRAPGFCLLALLCLKAASGQAQPADHAAATSPPPVEEQNPGAIQGTVLSGGNGQTLRRAQVLLRPVDSKGVARYETTDESGGFSFPNVAPGNYSITVQRDGYLPLSAGRIGDYKMPPIFAVNPGQTISSLLFRMTPSAVLTGKVKFDDAEPAVNVLIQLFRSRYERGRHSYVSAGSALTDDRGEYRVHGLEPGSYYVAAMYQAPPLPPQAKPEIRKDSLGNPLPELNYAVTFFPQVQKMSDAVAVKVEPGDEVAGIDIFLTLVHTVHIRGRVVSAAGGVMSSPSITLRINDADNTASIGAPVNVVVDKDQNFDIQGVTAGPYLLMASGTDDGVALTGRVPINIGDADVSNANIVAGPETKWTGKVRMDDAGSALPKGLTVLLQPRRTTAAPARATVSQNGDFSVSIVPNETYDLYVRNLPEDVYLKSVRTANSDRLASGLEAAPGETPPALDILLSSQGGEISGRAVTSDSKVVASGATIALIPDPAFERVQAYQTTHADEYGNFELHGVPPGKYVLVAWLDTPPCEIFDPDDLPACQAQGTSLAIDEGEQHTLLITAN